MKSAHVRAAPMSVRACVLHRRRRARAPAVHCHPDCAGGAAVGHRRDRLKHARQDPWRPWKWRWKPFGPSSHRSLAALGIERPALAQRHARQQRSGVAPHPAAAGRRHAAQPLRLRRTTSGPRPQRRPQRSMPAAGRAGHAPGVHRFPVSLVSAPLAAWARCVPARQRRVRQPHSRRAAADERAGIALGKVERIAEVAADRAAPRRDVRCGHAKAALDQPYDRGVVVHLRIDPAAATPRRDHVQARAVPDRTGARAVRRSYFSSPGAGCRWYSPSVLTETHPPSHRPPAKAGQGRHVVEEAIVLVEHQQQGGAAPHVRSAVSASSTRAV